MRSDLRIDNIGSAQAKENAEGEIRPSFVITVKCKRLRLNISSRTLRIANHIGITGFLLDIERHGACMARMSIVLIDIMLDPLQANVLIIGGGFSGTIVAAQLLRRNHDL